MGETDTTTMKSCTCTARRKKIKDALKNNRSVKNPSASNFFIDNTEEIQKLVFHE